MNDLLAVSAIATAASMNPGVLSVLGISPANWQSRGAAMASMVHRSKAPTMAHRISTPTPGAVAQADDGVTVADDYKSRWKI